MGWTCGSGEDDSQCSEYGGQGLSKASDLAPFPFVQTGSYPVRDGNLIGPLVDGEPAFRRVCEAIQHAQHSVWVTVTVMWPEFTTPEWQGLVHWLDPATHVG